MVEDKKDYLKQLKEIEKKSRFREARKKYKEYRTYLTGKGFYASLKSTRRKDKYSQGKKFLEAKEVDPIETAALAYALMREGIARANIEYSFLGAQLYEKIGRGRKAIPRLLRGAKSVVNRGHKLDDVFKDVYSKIEIFIKKNAGEREQDESGLEKKFSIFIAFIIGGAALSLGSLTITGNVVSNLTKTTPGLLGIILFIAGLVGVFFYFRGK